MNITEFLLARIAEDEAAANAVDLLSSEMETISTHYLPEFADYMLRWQPNAVRAESAAKRAIISLAKKASDLEKEYDDHEWQGTVESAEPLTGDAILYALATVYADHPDYRQEWAG